MIFFKQRISYHRPPPSFDSMNLSLPTSFQTIDDPTLRHRLLDRQEKILEQTKIDMMAVMMTGAEAIQRQCQKEFDTEMTKLWQDYRKFSSEQRITPVMMDLIDERFNNVTERIQSIYHFKVNYFFLEAPTVMKKNIPHV